MARELTAYGFTAGQYVVGVGASFSVLVQAAPGEISSTVKYFSGGSLELIGCTGPGATGGVVAGSGYLFDAGEAVNIDGAARYYLCATGATAIAYFAKGLSQGF